MIIGIDANEVNIKDRVGSNEYAFQILNWIWKIQNSPLRQSFGGQVKFKIYLKENPPPNLPKETDWWKYQILKPGFLWTQWRLPLELYFGKHKPDVFLTLGHYAPRFCPIPNVICIMDLAFLRFPKQFKKDDLYQLTQWTKYSVKKASHIFAISEFTKKEIIHFYKVPENKITVTYPGVEKLKVPAIGQFASGGKSEEFEVSSQSLKLKYQIKGQYFLYLGTLQPRKNLIRLIEAYSLLTTHYSLTKLVIAGKKGWLYGEIFKKVKELNLEDKVTFTGFVSEEEKTTLLKNALALVLPSLYEGFGMPVLEALRVGCPVIISKNSSLPEIVGQEGIYIDNPCSVESIYQKLIKMLKLPVKQKKELIFNGYQQVKRFSWENSSRIILKRLKDYER